MGVHTNGETFCKDVGWASRTPRGMTSPWCQTDPSQDWGKIQPAGKILIQQKAQLYQTQTATGTPISVAAVVNCTLHLAGFLQWSLLSSLGRQGLGPQHCFAEHSLKPGFLSLCPEKTEGAEVRHGSSSLAVHPQPRGPDAMVLGHQETTSFMKLQEMQGQNQSCSQMMGRL